MTAELYSDPSADRRVHLPSRVASEGLDAKIVVLGNSGVGKTSLLHRFVQDSFDPAHTTATTSAFFAAKRVYVDNHKVRLQLWDTAGQERFRSMAPIYYRGANAALLLYDITNLSTFEDLHTWASEMFGILHFKHPYRRLIFQLQELRKNCNTDLIIYIVGAKADLSVQREVTVDRIRLCLRKWFPPPRPPTPPPRPSDEHHIRPRFTSLTSMTTSHSVPFLSPRTRTKSQSPSPAPPMHSISPDPLLKRSKTSVSSNPIVRPNALSRRNTSSMILPFSENQSPNHLNSNISQPRRPQVHGDDSKGRVTPSTAVQFPSHPEFSHTSLVIEEIEEGDGEEIENEWGSVANIKLFEVSAKDDLGVRELFDTLIRTIISKRAVIDSERELRERDSVYLGGGVMTPTWAAVADEEEARIARSHARWSCC